MLSLVENAKAAVSDSRDVRGTLHIGALQSTASARLPDVLRVYAESYAQVDIAVETGTSAELIGKVIESRLDGAFVSGVEDHPALDVVTSFVEELVIITPATYRTVRAYLKQSTLPKVLVFKSGCHYRHRLERYLGGDPTPAGCRVRRLSVLTSALPAAVASPMGREPYYRWLGETPVFRRVQCHAPVSTGPNE